MAKLVLMALAIVLASVTTASAQPNVTFDSPFLVRPIPKLKKNNVIAITNTGAAGTVDRCAHLYVFDPGGQMLACCSCLVSPNTLRSLAIGPGVLGNPKPFPKAAVVKILGAAPVSNECNAVNPGALSSGLVVTDGGTPFSPSTLSAGEFSGLTTRCSFLPTNATLCAGCRPTSP